MTEPEPPLMPPDGADPLVWTLARQVWLDHTAGPDGCCPRCREPAPCGPRHSASLAIALGARLSWRLP